MTWLFGQQINSLLLKIFSNREETNYKTPKNKTLGSRPSPFQDFKGGYGISVNRDFFQREAKRFGCV